ncbi:MAG: hypothetical protein HY360_02960 [Verrucomicrobia bacterium]|nr:hypothetical protein [Verrucomicrobiota bacterium]
MSNLSLKGAKKLEKLIREQDWIYEDAGTRWADGLILGNGNLGVIGYAPYGLEWVLNKADVFDGRPYRGRLLPHDEVMAHFHRKHLRNLAFLNQAEAPPAGSVGPLSKSAALLRLRFGNESGWAASRPHRVRQRLCLWEGELYGELDLHLSHPRLRCFVPRPHSLFCLRLENCGAVLWDHIIELARPADDDLKAPTWRTGEGLAAFQQRMPHHGASYAVAALVAPAAGPRKDDLFQRCLHPRYRVAKSSVGESRHGTHHGQILQFGNADVFVAIRTSYECRDPLAAAIREVRHAARTGFDSLERAHRRWWRAFWEKGWADFGRHREIQKYWTFSLYETGCLFGKAPMPGLYGLWHGPTDGPRSGIYASAYTHDQNVQMPAMPIFAVNHPEFVEPFADMYLHALDERRRCARRLFGRPGIYFPLEMNPLGKGLSGGAYRYSLIGGPYSGVILVWAWRYTRNRRLLRERLYPLLREIVRFHVAGMRIGTDDRYHLDWEIPPEIYTLSRDCTATLALLRPCLETVIEASRLFNCDARERQHWEDVLARYPDYPRHPNGGWWAGSDVPKDHYTQAAYLLYPFFPGECADDDRARTAARTLRQTPQHDIEMSYADTNGRWHYKRSWAWFFPTVARLRLGKRTEAWTALHECLRLFSKPNGMFTHNPVVEADPRLTESNLKRIPRACLRHADGILSPISEFHCYDAGSAATLHPDARRWVTPASEGSGAFLFAATETLLQSHDGLIRLFPAVPGGFSGQFHRLLAQGAVEVSAAMDQGRIVYCKLKARRRVVVRLLDPSGEGDRKGTVLEIPLSRNRNWTWRKGYVPTEAGIERF